MHGTPERERSDVPSVCLQGSDVNGGGWKDQRDVTGNNTGAGRKLSGGDDRLALSPSTHADQRLHRQPGRVRPDGHSVVHLGSPGQ